MQRRRSVDAEAVNGQSSATSLQSSVILFITIVALAAAAVAGYVVGTRRRARAMPLDIVPVALMPEAVAASVERDDETCFGAEKSRLIRSRDAEAAALRKTLEDTVVLRDYDDAMRREREQMFEALATAREDSARYRQLVVDIENNAPPPILSGAGEPDDLKMIVGIGPVLERMLHNLGVTTFRQIGRWTPRDVIEFDARLVEFPGRIQRDQWVTQARSLHQSKYGIALG